MSELKNSEHHAGIGMAAGLREAVARVWNRVAKLRRQAQAVAELRRLDDRQLKDIGIARDDIPCLVAGLVEHRAKTAEQHVTISRPVTVEFRKAA